MICTDCLHISLNRFLLLAVDLWPYQQSILVRFQLILFFGILATFIIFQFTILINLKCTLDVLINVLSSALFYTILAIKYFTVSINIKIYLSACTFTDTNVAFFPYHNGWVVFAVFAKVDGDWTAPAVVKVKCLLEQLQRIHNELTDKNEISIIKKYSSYAKRYTVIIKMIFKHSLVLIMFCISALILYLFWLHIFDILLFTNGTRSHHSLPFMTEYFIDQEKYFYLILFHANAAFIIGCTAMLAIGTMLIVCLQHACGMFRITSYRIARAMTFKTQQKKTLQNKNSIYKGLICAVDMHHKAMKFTDSLIRNFEVMFFFLIIVGVLCGSFNFFRVYHVVSFEYDVMELLLPVLFIIIQFVYMMISNYLAQEITDHNNDVYVTMYDIQWYVAPVQVQKMVLFLLQRNTKAFNIEIAGLFVASLEGATTLLSTAISYFTVLHSTRH